MMLKRGFHHSVIKGAIKAPLLLKDLFDKTIVIA